MHISDKSLFFNLSTLFLPNFAKHSSPVGQCLSLLVLLLIWRGRNRQGHNSHCVFIERAQQAPLDPTTLHAGALNNRWELQLGTEPRSQQRLLSVLPLHHPYAFERERPLKQNWNKRTAVCVQEREKSVAFVLL